MSSESAAHHDFGAHECSRYHVMRPSHVLESFSRVNFGVGEMFQTLLMVVQAQCCWSSTKSTWHTKCECESDCLGELLCEVIHVVYCGLMLYSNCGCQTLFCIYCSHFFPLAPVSSSTISSLHQPIWPRYSVLLCRSRSSGHYEEVTMEREL